MKSRSDSLRMLGVISALAIAGCANPDEGRVPNFSRVTVESGTLVGEVLEDIRTFKGIPYAAPPVGDLRWAAPAAPLAWDGDRSAASFSAACPQPDFASIEPGQMTSGEAWTMWTGVPMAPDASEDCLYLNVWGPLRAEQAPVMVFIHGGGGSGAIPWWDGTSFARSGIVLVTINYRNFTQGKFAHPALTRAASEGAPLARYDLMDQIAALEWVSRNIAAFGGDRRNITLFGQSAGGAATLQLLTTPSAAGLFHKAIVQSGAGWWAPMNHTEYEQFGSWLAEQAGLPAEQATVAELRSLSPEAMPWYGGFNYDGRLLPESPTEAIAAGRMIDVPMMIGWTDFDGSSLRYDPADVIGKAPPEVRDAYTQDDGTGIDLAYAMYTDSHVGAPARWVAKRTSAGAPTFLYVFSYVREADQGRVRGAAHGSELPFVFDSWAKAAPVLVLTDQDQAVVRAVHSCWVSFARTGEPQCEGAEVWPRYDPTSDQLMELGTGLEVRTHYRKRQLDAQESAMYHTLAEQRRSLDNLLNQTAYAGQHND